MLRGSLCPQHNCPASADGKQHHNPFPPSSSCALYALKLVHTDLSGPAHVPGTGGVIYCLTITDDFTCWHWLTNKHPRCLQVQGNG